MWVEFVSSLLYYERFSPGSSGFPLFSKTYFRFESISIQLVKEELHCRDVSNTEAELISKHDVDESENVI